MFVLSITWLNPIFCYKGRVCSRLVLWVSVIKYGLRLYQSSLPGYCNKIQLKIVVESPSSLLWWKVMLKWIMNTIYKQKTNHISLSWTDIIFLCIYSGQLKISSDFIMSALDDFLTNGVQTQQHPWKKSVDCVEK